MRIRKAPGICKIRELQAVDKLGVGCYAQHHFSFKTSFLFIFFKINKNLSVF